jgi:hypothetical protein
MRGRKPKPLSQQIAEGQGIRTIADLIPDQKNANKGTERGNSMIERSLREYGAGRSIRGHKSKIHPAVRVSRGAWVQFGAFCDRFGLAPSSRHCLVTEAADEKQQEAELWSLLSQPRKARTEGQPN